ncbi:AraC family transcriptional regulator N-terminal domain-containing protein [Kribbella italica]|uniref:AraC-like DNA-binding protein n=1 Tax=Kribbella italica TaxID=1540520 RepID=A0A7W9J1W5_9ACTN|nr:AraC-like DNA-binding protein [Kribbella italica]
MPRDQLTELRDRIAAHARPDLSTAVDGLTLSKVEYSEPDYSLTEPLLVVMAQGAKRLLLGDETFDYHAGDLFVVTTDLPVSGHFVDATPKTPALGMGITLRAEAIAPLLLQTPPVRRTGATSRTADATARTVGAGDPPERTVGAADARGRRTGATSAIATGPAGPEILDAALRLMRLLESPTDIPVLAPLIERELLWRLLTGPHADVIRQIGLADSSLTHVNRAIHWIRDNYAEPLRVADLASLAGMSPAAFHRHFRGITNLSPLQFQKRIRLQEARSLLAAHPRDIAGVGHLVGYDSPSQFNREYRRLFGTPPGADAARLRTA